MYTVLYGTSVRSVKACIGSLYMLNKVCVSACMECCIWPERDMLLVVWSVVYGQKGTCDYLYGVLYMAKKGHVISCMECCIWLRRDM